MRVEGNLILIEPLKENPAEYFYGIFKKGPSLTKALLKDRKEEKSVKEKILLDFYAVLAYLKGEKKCTES